jgi:hypothetical protein
MGMCMGVNPYPSMDMDDPIELFFYRVYEYVIVIPGEDLYHCRSPR